MIEWLNANVRSELVGVAVATGQAVLRITLVLVAGCVGARFLRAGIRRLEAVFIAAGERAEVVPGATRKRITTLTGVLRTLVLVLIWAMVTVICLSQLGFDVTPIVAGAGIAGLAVRRGGITTGQPTDSASSGPRP